MSPDECAAFGERARELGLVVGEVGMWENLLTDDQELQAQRIARVRALLRNADEFANPSEGVGSIDFPDVATRHSHVPFGPDFR